MIRKGKIGSVKNRRVISKFKTMFSNRTLKCLPCRQRYTATTSNFQSPQLKIQEMLIHGNCRTIDFYLALHSHNCHINKTN